MARKKGRKSRTRTASNKVIASKRKLNLVIGNLILSVILLVLFIGMYYVTSNEVLRNFFWMLSMIFGFVGLAFFIIWLVLIFLRILKK